MVGPEKDAVATKLANVVIAIAMHITPENGHISLFIGIIAMTAIIWSVYHS